MKFIGDYDLSGERKQYRFGITEYPAYLCRKICRYARFNITNITMTVMGEKTQPINTLQYDSKEIFLHELSNVTNVIMCSFRGLIDGTVEVFISVKFELMEILVTCNETYKEYEDILNEIEKREET